MTEGQEQAIAKLRTAAKMRAEAREAYNEAIIDCMVHHVSKVRMAAEAGITEAGIRMYIKRNQL